jgi:hypothetical protein
MMSESVVAGDTGLVLDEAAAALISSDETAERLPRLDVTILAVESLVGRGDRAGRMDTMLTQPNVIGHPTERQAESDDESDRRTMCGDLGDDASQAMDSRPGGHETSWTVGSGERVLITHPLTRDRRIATHGRYEGRRQK